MLAVPDILAGLLDDARRGHGRALVLRGGPAARTARLLAGAEAAAAAAGTCVLRARGSARERDVPFAGLHRLLEPALPRIDGLPRRHGAALRGALGLGGPPDDRHLIGIAVLHLLGDLAEERPVLALLDDAHWLDPASRQALALAARRLDAERVAVIVATCDATPAGLPVLDLGDCGQDAGRPTEPGPPDEQAAQALDQAADAARRRRAPGVAAQALERAAALSQRPADRARRLGAAAEAALAADDRDHARTLLDATDALAADPAVRARLDFNVARLEVNRSPAAALARLVRAAEAGRARQLELAGPILAFAGAAAWHTGDWRRLAAVADGAGDLPGPSGPFLGQVVRDLAGPFAAGSCTALNPFASAIDLFESFGLSPWLGPPAPVIDLVGHEAPALAAYERMVAACRTQGRVGRLIDTLVYLAWTDLYTGRWASAAAAAAEGLRLCRDTEQSLAGTYLGVLCRLAALRGEARLACRLADEQRAATGSAALQAEATWSLALLDLGDGGDDGVAAALDRLAGLAPLDRWPDHRVMALQASSDLVEAAVRCGRRDVAERALGAYETWAGPDAAPVVRLRVHCGHALLAAGVEAETRFQTALAVDGLQRPFEVARVHLLYGEWMLAEDRRQDARAELREAVRAFDRLGAAPWARRARRQLRASGATVHRRQLRQLDRLTPEELPVARLAAQGLADREIAALLFLGTQTVRSRLAGVLARLGITTRAELSTLDLDDSPDRALTP